MNKLSDDQMDLLLRSQEITAPGDMQISTRTIFVEINRRRKRRWRNVALVTIVPVGLLAVAGFGYEQVGNKAVQTHRVNEGMSAGQLQQMLHGESRGYSALDKLQGWLQKQEDNNPATWDTAPFKSYRILSLEEPDSAHATGTVKVLSQTDQWHTYYVSLVKQNGQWAVTSPPLKP
jgi:hypothetical protein